MNNSRKPHPPQTPWRNNDAKRKAGERAAAKRRREIALLARVVPT